MLHMKMLLMERFYRFIYFVAEYDKKQLCYQEEELEGAYLMTYEEAMNAFQFESSKRILNEAKEFIKY